MAGKVSTPESRERTRLRTEEVLEKKRANPPHAKRLALIKYLAKGGDVYDTKELMGACGVTEDDALDLLRDSVFKKELKKKQDEMHYDAVRRLKASTPLAIGYLVGIVNKTTRNPTTPGVNAAKEILALTGISGGSYETEDSLSPSDKELLELIKSIPKSLRHFDD